MAVLDHSQTQKIITSTLVRVLMVACLLFSGLLIAKALELSNSTGVLVGQFGPLRLFELSKLPVADGYTGGFRMLIGTVVYFSVWLTTGFIVAWSRVHKMR